MKALSHVVSMQHRDAKAVRTSAIQLQYKKKILVLQLHCIVVLHLLCWPLNGGSHILTTIVSSHVVFSSCDLPGTVLILLFTRPMFSDDVVITANFFICCDVVFKAENALFYSTV